MFGGRFSSSIGPVGIDFGSRGIKMLQLREQGGKLHVVGAARIDVPLTAVPKPLKTSDKPNPDGTIQQAEPADGSGTGAVSPLTEQIRAAFTAGGFTGRRCVVSLAREDVNVQSIRLPKMPDEELAQTVVWEASQRFGFDRNLLQADFVRTGAPLQTGETRDEIIIMAASHAAIRTRLQPLLDAGLRPVAVEAGFTSLGRALSRQARRDSDRAQVRAVVEIGSTGSCIIILQGDQIAFCKPIAIGGTRFNQAVAEHLQIDDRAAAELRGARIARAVTAGLHGGAGTALSKSESILSTDAATDRAVYEAVRPFVNEIVKEVTLCLRYYGVTFRGHPPETIILTGGDGLEPRLGEVMTNACKTPVAFDDSALTLGGLINEIQTSLNRTPGPAACWSVAAGVALRGLGPRSARKNLVAAEIRKEAA